MYPHGEANWHFRGSLVPAAAAPAFCKRGKWVRGWVRGGLGVGVIWSLFTFARDLSRSNFPMTPFVFPSLRNADLLLCMKELGVPFAEEDVQKPTPQRMQMAYEAFLDILMGYTRETFDANVRACASEVDNFVFYSQFCADS
jgi:Nuf2 family